MIWHLLYIGCFLLPAALAASYYTFLMLASLAGARARAPSSSSAAHTFALVIPAHNEEKAIADVLRSCAELEYPADKYQIFVIADNCSDRTAEVARVHRATCLERHDHGRIGKGFALEWAFAQILPQGCDAVVVLDADCVIDRHALRVFDRCLQDGSKVLQANYVLTNPDASPISYVARVGNFLEYEFFYAPKSDLGLAVMLVGTGMVLHREVLLEHPWTAHSLVEDVEHTLTLARHGVRVRFVANVRVMQASAERVGQLTVQRTRWAGGTFRLGKRFAARIFVEGLARRRLLLVDAAWTLLVVSRPMVVLHLLLTLALGVLLALLRPDPFSQVLLGVGFGLAAAYVVYFTMGVLMVGLSLRRVCYLFAAPVVLAVLAIIAVRSLIVRRTAWARMPRL